MSWETETEWKTVEVKLENGFLMMRGGARKPKDTWNFSGIGDITSATIKEVIRQIRPLKN